MKNSITVRMLRKFLPVVLVVCLAVVTSCRATDDVNIREFEMVADHLGEDDCRRLIEALNTKGFFLQENVTGSRVSRRTPCIDMLLTWNHRQGSKMMAIGQ